MHFLAPGELRAIDSGALEELLARTELVVAAGAGEVRGLAAAALVFADYAWLDRWMQGRSTLALDSAATLIRMRGGDTLERAEFARLFAIGEPQRGLEAFLSRRSPKT